MIDYPKELDAIFNKFKTIDALPIIVGGFVRDKLLGIDSKDIDIEVYNILSYEKLEEVLVEFGDVNSVGKSFGVCKLRLKNLELDFTLPRVESKISAGHRGFHVEIQKNINFLEASSRRDFTINSIGYDPLNKIILDPFNGIGDLNNKILRATSKNTFKDDPLRALRAVQFCARFELTADRKLKDMIISMMEKNLLHEIARERIFTEFKKLLLKSKRPSIGFRLMSELNIIDYFSELKDISLTSRYDSLLNALDKISHQISENDANKTILMFAVICFYIDNAVSIKSFLDRFTNDKVFLKSVFQLIVYKDIGKENFNSYELSKLSAEINLNQLFNFLSIVHQNDSSFIEELRYAKELSVSLNILNSKIPPLLGGRDLIELGLSPSEEFGIILEKAYDAQLKNEFTTHEEALLWLKNSIIS